MFMLPIPTAGPANDPPPWFQVAIDGLHAPMSRIEHTTAIVCAFNIYM